MANFVVKKAEEILDKRSERYLDVIVHLRPRDRFMESAINAIARATKDRSLVIDRRDLLPPPAKRLAGRRSKADLSYLRRQSFSMSAQMAASSRGVSYPSGASTLAASSSAALQSYLTTETVQLALDKTAGHYKDRYKERHSPSVFWSSDSTRVTVHRDQLVELVSTDSRVQNVMLNLQIPPPSYAVNRDGKGGASSDRYKVVTWGVDSIGATKIWGVFGTRGKVAKVAVLDTGVDPDHKDLKGKVTKWAEFNAQGREVVGSTPHDTDRHGTHVCGTIAGGDQSGTQIGVAPDAELYVGMVLDGKVGGSAAQVLAGLDWAIASGADVVNMSLGGLNIDPVIETPYQRAILSALAVGVPIVAAIGNDGHQTTGSPGNDFFAFAIGASDVSGRSAGFSGGRTQMIRHSTTIDQQFLPLVYSKPDLSAPGVDVYSSVPGGGWEAFNGTSMATPHVSGAIALLVAATTIGDKLSDQDRAAAIQDLLIATCMERGESGQDHRFGFGFVDVFGAVAAARNLGY